jgi:3D (Asp-Asp-Asp) domain-containing protein
MGTRLYVEGYGEGIAADQGGAIKGNRLDLCFSSHQEALDWGIKTVKVTIL